MKLSESDCILFRFDLPDASSGLFRTQIMLGRGKKGQCHRIALDREGLRGTVRSPAPSCQWAARNRNIDISMRGFQVHNEGVSEGFPGVSGGFRLYTLLGEAFPTMGFLHFPHFQMP